MTAAVDPIAEAEAALPERRARHAVWRNPGVIFGGAVLLLALAAALLAPTLGTVDPILLKPRLRLRPPSTLAWLGTAALRSACRVSTACSPTPLACAVRM